MKEIHIRVADKLPKVVSMSGTAVTDNRYRLTFEFDDEWETGLKTVIVAERGGEFVPYLMNGNAVEAEFGGAGVVYIGVLQGTLVTSRPCQIFTEQSIRKIMKKELPVPEPDVWSQITEQVRALDAVKVTGIRAEQKTVEGSLLDTSYTEITVELADGSKKTCRLPNTGVKETLILDSMPNGGTVGYVGQMAFVKSTGQMYVCVVGLVGDYSYVPSYEWQQAKDIRIESGAPTTGSAGKWGDVWIDVSEPAVYICGGFEPLPGTPYIWKKISGLPVTTEEDEGKVLGVEDGAPAWKELPKELPNPFSLKISGGPFPVPVIYDGSSPVVVQLATSTDAPGDSQRIYMRVDGGYIQYSANGETWHDVIAVSALKGQDAPTPYIGGNGNWFVGAADTGVKARGDNGEPGITPHIGDNGNWYVGETDTGVSAGGSGGGTKAFAAEYGETKFADIVSAIEAGQTVVLSNDGYYAPLVLYDYDIIQFTFIRGDLVTAYSVHDDDTWVTRTTRLARDEEGVPEVDYNGNDDGKVLTVSGNKAVWKNVVLTDEDKTEIAQIAVGLLPKYAGEVENA